MIPAAIALAIGASMLPWGRLLRMLQAPRPERRPGAGLEEIADPLLRIETDRALSLIADALAGAR